MQEQESVIGILKQIRFQSDQGFLIGIFSGHGQKKKIHGTFSALGSMINPEIGLAYKLFGQWEANGQWGSQFKFTNYEVLQPSDTKGIYQYLVRVCKWVGPTVAGRIVDKYGTDTLTVLKTAPEKVASEINGITKERATEIQTSLKKNEYIEKAMVELEKIFAPIAGLRKSMAAEVIQTWKSDSIDRLKANPYILTQINGVGFPTADKVAQAMGFDPESIFRESAAASHIISESMQAGSVWIDKNDLAARVKTLIGRFNGCLSEMVKDAVVIVDDGMVTTTQADRDETYIARKIMRMA